MFLGHVWNELGQVGSVWLVYNIEMIVTSPNLPMIRWGAGGSGGGKPVHAWKHLLCHGVGDQQGILPCLSAGHYTSAEVDELLESVGSCCVRVHRYALLEFDVMMYLLTKLLTMGVLKSITKCYMTPNNWIHTSKGTPHLASMITLRSATNMVRCFTEKLSRTLGLKKLLEKLRRMYWSSPAALFSWYCDTGFFFFFDSAFCRKPPDKLWSLWFKS